MQFVVAFLLKTSITVRVPTQTGKMGRHFPVREKSGNFEQTVRENHTKYWKNIREFQKNVVLFLVIFKNELCIIC